MQQGQILRGTLFLIAEIAIVSFVALFGGQYVVKLANLGSVVQEEIWDDALGIFTYSKGDNSMLILLYGVVTLFIIAVFVYLHHASVKEGYVAEQRKKQGLRLPTTREDLNNVLNENFHVTLLSVPTLGLVLFTILPLIFMVLIAFTNYDRWHMPPGNLFTWVGFQNFSMTLFSDPLMSQSFWKIASWTLVWAVFSTFTNYIFGMILAMLINKKGIKHKKLFRNIFVITIAVPQFVSLMLMSKLLADQGTFNVILQKIGIIAQDQFVPFLSNANFARVVIIIVNMWVGIPYTMLITTGILMNIPADLYESAKIDGASPFTTYFKITLPYVLFVTTPYLITQFIGNINNFNVIWLLTGGGPLTLDYYNGGQTDLLVTWLFRLTNSVNDYKLAAVIGILTFVICATFSLVVYSNSASVKKEEEFQ